ncbi:hypothetical protein FK535_19480 [Mycolicibacterium sp. 018/SC-01/001]|uniref:hypothetical protein n=1 Tax=Mycolicibacterium sp. 018/SC-01/001 TaxID=2592069 RepID=UPI001180D9E2|nr:hypothetical protein [Mycolicibacterium sp. 018/SC-01/001]TRW80523.1 hypothetical protein FK535_19480 [Mycolicibacterium sp. 018/SC-01/001]
MTNRARAATLSAVARALFVAALLTGCHSAAQEETTGTSPTRPAFDVRHDTDELARLFPALGAPVSASWIRWNNGGAATWTDAVVTVTPSTMNDLLQQHVSEPTTHRPAVQKVLEADVPPGPFRSGVELNMAFSPGSVSTRVFLDPPRDTVVLQSFDLG